jgi:hypothetical protein
MNNEIDIETIDKLISSSNCHKNVVKLLSDYVKKDPSNLVRLLQQMAILSVDALDEKTKVINLGKLGIEYMINLIESKNFDLPSAKDRVIQTWPAIQAYFPNGVCDGASSYGKNFFRKFVDDLRNATDLIDSDWAMNCGCNDYLKMVLDKNNP